MTVDPDLLLLLEVLVGVLVLATGIGWVLGRRATTESGIATVANLNSRIRAWWVMWAMFGFAVVVGRIGSVIFFGLASVLALREFLTIVPTRPGDHRALWWTFFVITPLQYVLVATNSYGLFSVLIPVFAFLFIPVRIAIAAAALPGAGLWWATPFSPWQAGLISLLIALVGFTGDLTMSAIKRDCGVKDYGSMIHGHGGIMDRVDSICFAAPVFFHVVRYFFT